MHQFWFASGKSWSTALVLSGAIKWVIDSFQLNTNQISFWILLFSFFWAHLNRKVNLKIFFENSEFFNCQIPLIHVLVTACYGPDYEEGPLWVHFWVRVQDLPGSIQLNLVRTGYFFSKISFFSCIKITSNEFCQKDLLKSNLIGHSYGPIRRMLNVYLPWVSNFPEDWYRTPE